MSFSALMYHELRTETTLNAHDPSPIKVKQNYDDQLPAVLFCSLKNFDSQMAYLYELNYHTLTLDEIKNFYYKDVALPEKSVLLSFDDCYQSLYHYAYPILRKYGFSAVAFVVTGWLNNESTTFDPTQSICLSEDELRQMSDVFDYANHTDLFHTRSSIDSNKLMTSSHADFTADLERCNQNSLITAKDAFAYPFGLFNDTNVETLKANGFKLAFTSDGGVNLATTDPLRLNRFVIPHFMALESFKEILRHSSH